MHDVLQRSAAALTWRRLFYECVVGGIVVVMSGWRKDARMSHCVIILEDVT